MVTARAEEEIDRTIPEDTILGATLVEVNLKTVNYTDKKTGKPASFDKLEWWFEVTDDRNDGLWRGRKVRGESSAELTTHPANNFRNYTEALTGQDVGLGEVVDTDNLLGLKCQLSVKHRHYDGKTFEDVDVVMAAGNFNDDDVPF